MKRKGSLSSSDEELVILWAAVSTKAQDKYSVEDQLKLGREWCGRRGSTIVEELVVRGFSRDYWTLADVVAAAAHDPDMEAFAKLQAHIRKKSFTVFLCFDADRFGRTASLVHEVIGRITRDCEARIHTLFDGVWMDADTGLMIGTMKAYKAEQDVSRLKEYRVIGMDNRARAGKSTSSESPLFHRKVRDDRGKEISVVVNEELRTLWTDLGDAILRGVSWNRMEQVLFKDFGHGVDGKPYHPGYMRDLVTNPAFWGHAALNYRQHNTTSTKNMSPWIWDENTTPPECVTVYRNRLPAVYGGEWAEIGERVKQELWRRFELKGKATSANTFRFHGLLVCDECGYSLTMTTSTNPNHKRYVRCATAHDHRQSVGRGKVCTQRKYIYEGVIQDYFQQALELELADMPSALFQLVHDSQVMTRRKDEEVKKLAALKKRHDDLAEELLLVALKSRPTIRDKMEKATVAIDTSEALIATMDAELVATVEMQAAQKHLLELLRENGGVEWLWTQPDTFIHQQLSASLGHNQLVVRDGEIKWTIPMKPGGRLTRRKRESGTV